MSYLARDIGKRINPESLVPGAKSLIVTGLNYYTDKRQTEPGVPVLSIYAYGEAYQDVIKRKLSELLVFIKSIDRKPKDGLSRIQLPFWKKRGQKKPVLAGRGSIQ